MDMDDEILTSEGAGARRTPVPLWRRPLVLSAVGAAAAAAVVITVVAMNAGDDADPVVAGTTVTFNLAAIDPAMQSCMALAAQEPVAGAAALAGTVLSVEGAQVVLDVDRWYVGGDADRVQLQGADQSVALDGVDFVVGEEYLVTASEGLVQLCGASGPATPELEQIYDEWYG